MPTETEVITGTIEIKDAAVSQAGFGTPMLVATHTLWAERVRTFNELSDLTAAPLSVPTSHVVYKMAQALKSQKPSPSVFKVGKRVGAVLADDLAAIRAADEDWYGLVIDTASAADILAAAAWAEAQRVLFMAATADVDTLLPTGTTDIGTQLLTLGYKRTIPLYHAAAITQFPAAAWAGRVLPKAPGSVNWANKSLAGVTMSTLDATQRGALRQRNINYYVPIKGIGFTLDGRSSGGRYADITQGMDWFDARVQERVIGVLANSDKIGFTDKHLEIFRTQVQAQIMEGIGAQVIDGDQDWAVSVPRVSAINPNDRIARILPNLKFNFVLQGAVNKVQYAGTVLIAA